VATLRSQAGGSSTIPDLAPLDDALTLSGTYGTPSWDEVWSIGLTCETSSPYAPYLLQHPGDPTVKSQTATALCHRAGKSGYGVTI